MNNGFNTEDIIGTIIDEFPQEEIHTIDEFAEIDGINIYEESALIATMMIDNGLWSATPDYDFAKTIEDISIEKKTMILRMYSKYGKTPYICCFYLGLSNKDNPSERFMSVHREEPKGSNPPFVQIHMGTTTDIIPKLKELLEKFDNEMISKMPPGQREFLNVVRSTPNDLRSLIEAKNSQK